MATIMNELKLSVGRTQGDAIARDMRQMARVLKACGDKGEPELLATFEAPKGAERVARPNGEKYLVIGAAVADKPNPLEILAGHRVSWPVDFLERTFHALIVEPHQQFGVQQRPFHAPGRDVEVKLFGWRFSAEEYRDIAREEP